MLSTDDDHLKDLAHAVGDRLQRAGLMCATAESCTGGLVGHLITEIPGSSNYFAGGAITYSNEAKKKVLGVDHAVLLREGAVSAAVAQQMAQGAWRLLDADVAVAVTGIAGPSGGTPDKPVGTVYIHVSGADGYERGERYRWSADRSGNKLLSARAALALLQEYVELRIARIQEEGER